MKKILVVRNDKIGDFMLAWPAFALLKQSMNCHITALVPSYTESLAELCPSIDDVIIDKGKKSSKEDKKDLIAEIKSKDFDAAICYFSDTYNASTIWKAGIKQRWAPATKLAQIFYNHRIKQRRSRSLKPEFEYNCDLSLEFLQENKIVAAETAPPYLAFSPKSLSEFKTQLAIEKGLNEYQPWLLIHAGSGGSANNLSAEQYAQIARSLKIQHKNCEVILTAGPGEENLAQEVINKAGGNVHLISGLKLPQFCQFIACGKAFIAGSTGPLHIAGALDVPTIGFYPMRRSATPLRWKTLNSEGKHLAFTPAQDAQEEDMSSINISAVMKDINAWVVQFLF